MRNLTAFLLGGVMATSSLFGQAFQVGDPAPDFNLKLLGSEEYLSLSGFAGNKPVALVFGSFT